MCGIATEGPSDLGHIWRSAPALETPSFPTRPWGRSPSPRAVGNPGQPSAGAPDPPVLTCLWQAEDSICFPVGLDRESPVQTSALAFRPADGVYYPRFACDRRPGPPTLILPPQTLKPVHQRGVGLPELEPPASGAASSLRNRSFLPLLQSPASCSSLCPVGAGKPTPRPLEVGGLGTSHRARSELQATFTISWEP